MTQRLHQKRRKADPARRLAYSALLAVETQGAMPTWPWQITCVLPS
ncbi:ribosomal RNA small subunit methyltransferase B [Cutibacterium acnes JCM 18920]|nr:ribosomal RNA small subunit methyltransferase B [Cutibacterium acnes JCM 18920]